MKSIKWSPLTILVAAAASVALAVGCTVTEGDIDDENGGTVKPLPDSGTSDSGTASDGGTTTDGGEVCTDLAQKDKPLVSAECQACLEGSCCTEMRGCFNADPGAEGVDCDSFAKCVSDCYAAGDDAGSQQTCLDECNAATNATIKDAYDAILSCAEGNADCKTACGL